MKNKKFTFLLILAVAVVWGIIVYQLFKASEETVPTPLTGNKVPAKKAVRYFSSPDTFSLSLDYRDPFFAESTISQADSSPVQVAVKAPVLVKPFVDWQPIKYAGYILNPATKKRVSILSLNGREQMLEENQEAGGVKLLRNAGDSVLVRYQGEVKFLLLN